MSRHDGRPLGQAELYRDFEEALSSDEGEPQEEYEVERIIAQGDIDGQEVFLVKWKGYSDEQSTWVG